MAGIQLGEQERSKAGIYTWAARLDPWPRITLEQQVWLNTAYNTFELQEDKIFVKKKNQLKGNHMLKRERGLN
jgi:hypothetical protein